MCQRRKRGEGAEGEKKKKDDAFGGMKERDERILV